MTVCHSLASAALIFPDMLISLNKFFIMFFESKTMLPFPISRVLILRSNLILAIKFTKWTLTSDK